MRLAAEDYVVIGLSAESAADLVARSGARSVSIGSGSATRGIHAEHVETKSGAQRFIFRNDYARLAVERGESVRLAVTLSEAEHYGRRHAWLAAQASAVIEDVREDEAERERAALRLSYMERLNTLYRSANTLAAEITALELEAFQVAEYDA